MNQVLANSTKTVKDSPNLWLGQVLHIACLMILLIALFLIWSALEHPFPLIFWAAVATPVLHQVFVWIAWRTELRSSTTSNVIGFHGYLVIFFGLFVGRFVSLALLAWVDKGSLNLPGPVAIVLSVLIAIPGLYAIYSVRRYFGMTRAAGADHFDERYQKMPLVRKGIFRFTDNGMYLYAFLTFWAIAIGFNSLSALVVAAFSHAYIWVHFFATEKPDMDYIYEQHDLN